MVKAGQDGPCFTGDVIGTGRYRSKLYRSFEGLGIKASLGDTVRVNRHDGAFIGIIIALRETARTRVADILEFDTITAEQQRSVCTHIAAIP